jgi:MFS family permease
MQSAFLIVAKGYSEKHVGVLFFVFGMSQFLFQAPAGYLFDYTESKLLWLSTAGVLTTFMTVFTAVFATQDNFMLMVFIKFLQGAITSFIPPGLNSITQGIVGAVGMTEQVAVNEMMNHLGTAIIVLTGSLIAFFLYPNIGLLFVVSPIACVGFLWFLNQIPPEDIDHDAARGLTIEAKAKSQPVISGTPSKDGYIPPAGGGSGSVPTMKEEVTSKPSFVFGLGAGSTAVEDKGPQANTPLQVLRDPVLLTFILICFLFHTANGTILPLVMQTLAIGNGRSGILLSGLCITIAQIFMVMSARICGTYSAKYGRKWLFLIGLGIVPIRCAILGGLLTIQGDNDPSVFMQSLILATQILDGVGAGTFGTMYILVTSDISGGTGRFGLTLGLTTAAMSIGGTVSGYMGQALAQDHGYLTAFWILMFLSMVPALLYLFFMPETLPDHANSHNGDSRITQIKEEEEPTPETPQKTTGSNYTEMV